MTARAGFSDVTTSLGNIDSTWQRSTTYLDHTTQTAPLSVSEIGVSTHNHVDSFVQATWTAPAPREDLHSGELPAGLLRGQGLVPMVMRALERNVTGSVYSGLGGGAEEAPQGDNFLTLVRPEGAGGDLQCSAVAWSCTGQSLAAGFGRHDHEDWCEHRSTLCVWNIFRRNLNPAKADLTIEMDSCVTSLAFHPAFPSVLAGGSFSGQVRIWDTNREDPVLAASPVADFAHREPVTQLRWAADPSSPTQWLLVSTSGDGKVLAWNPTSKLAWPVYGQSLLASGAKRPNRTGGKVGAVLGGTALSFACDESSFVVGTEAGAVLKCALVTGAKAKSGEAYAKDPKEEVAYPSPIVFSLEAHPGAINAAECSPFHRNLAVTCAGDGAVRLWNLLQQPPVATISLGSAPLFCLSLSPTRPALLAAASADGHIHLVDLSVSRNAPVLTLTVPMRLTIYSLAFNKQGDLLASGDAAGNIRIWKLNKALSEERPSERSTLNLFAKMED